jgi:hypothetical protein
MKSRINICAAHVCWLLVVVENMAVQNLSITNDANLRVNETVLVEIVVYSWQACLSKSACHHH